MAQFPVPSAKYPSVKYSVHSSQYTVHSVPRLLYLVSSSRYSDVNTHFRTFEPGSYLHILNFSSNICWLSQIIEISTLSFEPQLIGRRVRCCNTTEKLKLIEPIELSWVFSINLWVYKRSNNLTLLGKPNYKAGVICFIPEINYSQIPDYPKLVFKINLTLDMV